MSGHTADRRAQPAPLSFGFDRRVPSGGYAWWYVDALSDDGANALTVIGFVGSVFSPYYAWAGRKDPEHHVALNVALYQPRGGRWSMTERGRSALQRGPDLLQLGPSALRATGDGLAIEIEERGWPIPRRLRGRVTVFPEVLGGDPVLLSGSGQHHWWPIAPRARVEVSFDEPQVRWSGAGYFDSNWGAAPLEQDFESWTWCRAPLSRGATVLYDVKPRTGPPSLMALRFKPGAVERYEGPAAAPLPSSLFGIKRATRSEGEVRLVRTLTDAPFYARSVVQSRLCGEPVVGVHESLELDRFDTTWTRLMLPFRMPRRANWP
jgi:carotenoid 1,2-hydratase